MDTGGQTGDLKIAVIGAGNVGAASAAIMAARDLGRIYLYDVLEDLAIGKAMDLNHASPFFHHDARVTGTNAVADLAGADVVVVTAGSPRRTGMTREDLLGENVEVCDAICRDVLSDSPDAKVLIVTNPVDILTTYLKDRRPEANVFGLGCTLDTVRLRFLIAEAAGAPVDSVDAMVIGTHSDRMIPLIRHATVDGRPVRAVLSASEIERVVTATREAGHRIVSKLRNRGSFYAAAHCVSAIVAAIVRDTREVFPLSVQCGGQYGHQGMCLALPCVVGADGPGEVLEVDLDEQEQAALELCAADVQAAISKLGHCVRP